MPSPAELKAKLQEMDEYDFEKFIADLWADQGWETRVLQSSNDQGIDIEARRADPIEQKQLIQAKRYSKGTKVGSEQVQQYSSLQLQEDNVDSVLIVTTTEFTAQARELSPDLNVKLVNGDDLVGIIRKNGAIDTLNEYLSSQTQASAGYNDPDGQTLSQTNQTLDPDDVPRIYVTKLIDDAMGNLVTENRLTKLKSGMSHPQTPTEQPIIGHLLKDEQPHFTLRCGELSIPGHEQMNPANNAYLVPTDHRVLVIVGMENEDVVITIPYRKVNDIDFSTGFASGKILIGTEEGQYSFSPMHLHYNESQASDVDDIHRELEACTQYIRENVYSVM